MAQRRPQQAKTDWRHRAACLSMDTSLSFPVTSTGAVFADITEAERVYNT